LDGVDPQAASAMKTAATAPDLTVLPNAHCIKSAF